MRQYIDLIEAAQEGSPADLLTDEFFATMDASPVGPLGHTSLTEINDRTVDILVIQTYQKRKGYGSTVMSLLCRLADKYGVLLTLSPAEDADGMDGGMEYGDLCDWYESYGFEFVRQSKMARRPEQGLTEAAQALPPVADGCVRLFRGDSSKIDQFSIAETSLYSLFGHGIYLTDNKRVAGDYVTKGGEAGEVLFRLHGAKTKEDVLNRWIERQAQKIDAEGNDRSGEVAYWTRAVPYSDGGDYGVCTNDLRKKERELRLQYARIKWEKMKRDYEVRIKLDGTGVIQKKAQKSNGQIAVFDIPAQYVAKVLHADDEITTDVLDDLCWVLDRFNDRDTARDIRQYVKQAEWNEEDVTFRHVYTGLTTGSPLIHNQEAHEMFRDALKQDGYVGIEYLGGITMGGGYKHRAFVFWDEATINKYRVK